MTEIHFRGAMRPQHYFQANRRRIHWIDALSWILVGFFFGTLFVIGWRAM